MSNYAETELEKVRRYLTNRNTDRKTKNNLLTLIIKM